jgi:hypothetical protein
MCRVSSAAAALKKALKDHLLLAAILSLGHGFASQPWTWGGFLRIRPERGWQPLASSADGTFRSLAHYVPSCWPFPME